MKMILTTGALLLPLAANASVVVEVPEPGALSMMMAGLALIGLIKLRNKLKK